MNPNTTAVSQRSARLATMSLVAAAWVFGPAAPAQAWQAATDYTALQALLLGGMPTGNLVDVAQIEAPDSSNYLPNTGLSEFSWQTFVDVTGAGGGPSFHSTRVGRRFYSNTTGAAPGIDTVNVYEANDYLDNVTGLATLDEPSNLNGSKVQNHSWVGGISGTSGTPVTDLEKLQRVDYQVEAYDIISPVGLNNGDETPVPVFLANAYNVITVGRTDGDHSRGVTTSITDGSDTYAGGRLAADIVVPESATSWATGVVSGAAAILVETGNGIGADATRSETIKAVLLAGATKDELAFGGNWDRNSTRPLDEVYGAGELNFLNSYNILTDGQQDGTENARGGVLDNAGWDYRNEATPESFYYDLQVGPGEIGDLSAILTWNQKVTDAPGQNWIATSDALTNLDLKLYNSTGTPLLGTLMDESISGSGGSVSENIEHIYYEDLAAGTYTLEVSYPGLASFSSGDTTDFALAWQLTTTVVPEPAALLWAVFALGAAAAVGRRRR
jgi:hypothetical protein